jgi:hypothetical protein
MTTEHTKPWIRLIVGACLAGTLAIAQAARIDIINIDGPGVGFSQTRHRQAGGRKRRHHTGWQRQIVFAFVADSGASAQIGRADSGDLHLRRVALQLHQWGSRRRRRVVHLGQHAEREGKPWYPQALANKLAAVQVGLTPDPDFGDADIISFFNGDLGKPGCLDGRASTSGSTATPTLRSDRSGDHRAARIRTRARLPDLHR